MTLPPGNRESGTATPLRTSMKPGDTFFTCAQSPKPDPVRLVVRLVPGSPEYRLAHVADASYASRVVETLSVKLPEPLAKWLIDEANSTRRSRSDLVREALELRRQGNGRTPKKRITMADAMGDLRGTVSGPTDLSTNPKYFADFGK